VKKVLSCLGVCLVLASCASMDKTEEVAMSKENTKTTIEETKRIAGYRCEKIKKTGTRFGKKVCSTAEQRKKAREVARQIMEDNQPGSQTYGKSGGS